MTSLISLRQPEGTVIAALLSLSPSSSPRSFKFFKKLSVINPRESKKMWPVLVAAAVAGSSLIAQNLFTSNAHHPTSQDEEMLSENPTSPPQVDYSSSAESHLCSPLVTGSNQCDKDGIFRFSTPNVAESPSSSAAKKLKRKNKKKIVEKMKHARRGVEVQKLICLNKKKTWKKCSDKCGSCSSKGESLFGWGVGVGIMYMMSAGKAEISKLNTAMDETARIVEDLKVELSKRKDYPRSPSQHIIDAKRLRGHHAPLEVKMSASTRYPNGGNALCLHGLEDAEYASSVLTGEAEVVQPDVMEMNQLEAELESELQKLSCSTTDVNFFEEIRPESEIEGFAKELPEQCSTSYPFGGVAPSELDKKLSKLLIEQQEGQINELESELHLATSKLHEKEAELRALKDCVRRLSQVSVSNVSDGEIEAYIELERMDTYTSVNKMRYESVKPTDTMEGSIES